MRLQIVEDKPRRALTKLPGVDLSLSLQHGIKGWCPIISHPFST